MINKPCPIVNLGSIQEHEPFEPFWNRATWNGKMCLLLKQRKTSTFCVKINCTLPLTASLRPVFVSPSHYIDAPEINLEGSSSALAATRVPLREKLPPQPAKTPTSRLHVSPTRPTVNLAAQTFELLFYIGIRWGWNCRLMHRGFSQILSELTSVKRWIFCTLIVFLPDGRTHRPVRPVALRPGCSWTGTRSPCGRWTIYTHRPRGKTANLPRCSVPHLPRSYTFLQWKVN